MDYLYVIERAGRNLSAYAPDVPGLGVVGRDRAEIRRRMAEGLRVHLDGLREDGDPIPKPVTRNPKGLELQPGDVVDFVAPAEPDPVALEVARAIAESGLTHREVAERMGVPRPSVSRLADPFYDGHSLASLRRLANALGLQVDVGLTACADPRRKPQQAG